MTGLTPHTPYRFAVSAYDSNGESDKVSATGFSTTTHIWYGGLKECVNIALGNNDPSHVPTRTELEMITHFYCHSKGLTEMEPVQDLKNLTLLYLYTNSINGSIPTWIGDFDVLSMLSLNENNFSGSIPIEFGSLLALAHLDLSDNNLSGSIPVEIGKLAALISLRLHDNNLSGSIPVEIGSLLALINLNLYDNSLSGSIPVEIGELNALEYLNFSSNQLSGNIPVEIGELTALKILHLKENHLSGNIPIELGTLPLNDEGGLDLRDNCHLLSDDSSLQAFIDLKASVYGGYPNILDTSGNCPLVIVPIISYLLD